METGQPRPGVAEGSSTTRRRLTDAAAFVLLYALAFPFRAGEVQLDAGLLVGWAALVPFARMLRGLKLRAAFAWGSASGTLAFCAILFWIYVVVHVHGGAAPAVAVLAVVLLALYCGVHVGLAAALTAGLEPRAGRWGTLVLPSAWVVSEHLRSFDLASGFPWAYLGYSQHANGPMRELASLGGVFGLSFLLATFAVLVSRLRLRSAVLLLALAHALGFVLLLPHLDDAQMPARSAGIVQGNVPQGEKWDPERAWERFTAHLDDSRLAAAAGDVDLIVWPEAAVPVLLELEQGYREALRNLARETRAALLVGGLGFARRGSGQEVDFYNSVFVLNPDGRFVDRYDKTVLVPFGEYVPFRRLLASLEGLATGIAHQDITPGPGPRPLAGLPRFAPPHALAPLICYEVIYPSLVRQVVRRGARILVNVTNDAWYGRSSGPHQFMAIAAMRSAEHGVPMIRAANTGVSAIVAAGGSVVEKTPIFERRVLRAPIPPARTGEAIYTRLGEWVVGSSWVLLIAIGGKNLVGRRRRRDQGDSRGASSSA